MEQRGVKPDNGNIEKEATTEEERSKKKKVVKQSINIM